MCILGAVFVDHVIVEELTDFMWIGHRPYKDYKVKLVARILASLGEGITELEAFYKDLPLDDQQPDYSRFFPFIREYRVGERVVRFAYLDYLTSKSPESASKALFRAIIKSEDGEPPGDIVVKFVESYNAKAHRLLATADHAPTLHYCSAEDPNPPELGGLIMVVMDYVDGQTARQLYADGQLPPPIFDQVKESLVVLHEQKLVFGDLRYPNIMISKEGRVLLIDFDWCGVHDEHTYPFTLNDARHMPNSINWHPDVKRGGRMRKEHDTYMLERMKPQS